MSTYILIMILVSSHTYGGVTVFTQEFNTMQNCEQARISLAKTHDGGSIVVKSQGCYRK